MLGRAAIQSSRQTTRRLVSSYSISRAHLDINAAAINDQRQQDAQDSISKSEKAIRGESLRGDVQLPAELQEAVDRIIQDADNKSDIRLKALELYAHLRKTSSIASATTSSTPSRDRQSPTSPTYDDSTSLAYLAGLMPVVYAATLHALTVTRNRLALISDWEPDRVVDYGSGTGSAAWAVQEVWGPILHDGVEAREYVGLDGSKDMIELSSSLFGVLPMSVGGVSGSGTVEKGIRLKARAHQLPIPSPSSALAKMQLGPSSMASSHVSAEEGKKGGKKTLALCAFTLGEQGTREKRKEMVRAMWASGAEVIVIVDRGTPAGSRMVIEAREQLLMYGRRETVMEEETQSQPSSSGRKKGAFVVAPCPHDGDCPLHHSSRSFCHFSQRVRSPPFLRHTKHSTKGESDSKFSYVVIQRGERPSSPSSTLNIDQLVETAVTDALQQIPFQPLQAPRNIMEHPGDELRWPRVVAAPLKRSGHVIIEVCSASEQLERHTIPKSQGKQEYYDARKVAWGDSFPHPPKNGPIPAPSGREDAQTARDKFKKEGSILRSKKMGRKDARSELEDRQGGRGERRRTRRDKEELGVKDGEVQEFELDIGSDGELRVLR
ncbi:Rsm22-domain-containing protein [Meredithblackwellia eburnea MCA 4105]